MSDPLLSTSISYPVVIGLSLFSIVWGVINVILVSHASTTTFCALQCLSPPLQQPQLPE
jgi:hypothetical protein